MSRSSFVFFFLLIAQSANAAGQEAGGGPVLPASHTRRWEIGVLAAAGPSAAVGSWGGVPGRHLVMGSVFFKRSFVRWHGFAASYIGEFVPVLVATRVPQATGHWFRSGIRPADSVYVMVPDGQGSVFGVGVLPLGLQFSSQVGHGVSIFAEASGGATAFTRAMPEPDARALNFLGIGSIGLRLGQTAHPSYLIGYRFTHISNAYTAKSNPGFNAHLFFLGLAIR